MFTIEATIAVILSALPQVGAELTFLILERKPNVHGYEDSTLMVEHASPLGMTACWLEGTVRPENQRFTASLSFGQGEGGASLGEIVIYTNEDPFLGTTRPVV